jgi:hypothetical protein
VTFTADHPDQELALARTMAALGICSEPAFFLFLDLVVEHSRDDAGFNVQRLNQLIGVAAAFGPRDEADLFSVLDLMLLHEATGEIRLDPNMSFRDQLSWLIKLTSAAAQLTDKLKKQRSGGHQQIRVEHLYQQTLLGVEAKPPALADDPTPTLAIEASPGPAPSPMPARAGRRRRGS